MTTTLINKLTNNTQNYYILKDKKPIATTLLKWAKWFEKNGKARTIAKTKIKDQTVSTVFLGIDHNFAKTGKPILFETMILPECDYCERYTNWKEAEKGHLLAVNSLNKTIKTKTK